MLNHMNTSEIILNEKLSNALINSQLKKKEIAEYKEEALFSLLMYDRAWISSSFKESFSNLDQSNLLKSESLLRVIKKKFFEEEEQEIIKTVDLIQTNLQMKTEIHMDDFRFYLGYLEKSLGLIKELVYPNFKENYPKLSINFNFPVFDLREDFFSAEMLGLGFRNILSNFNDYKKSFKDDIIEIASNDAALDIEGLWDDELFRFLRDEGVIKRRRKSKEKYYEVYDKVLKSRWDSHLNEEIGKFFFIAEYLKMRELLNFGSNTKIPIKLDSSIYPKSCVVNIDKKIKNSENHFGVYRILLEEVEYIPRLNTVEDVLELRQDKRIEDFRNVISEWSIAIMEGNRKEENIRREIRKANKELKHYPKHVKISGWATYISVPLVIVDILTQIPIASVLSLVSGIYNFKSNRAKKKNNWLLIGSKSF